MEQIIKKGSIEDSVLRESLKFGFTYKNSEIFKNWNQGNRIISKLLKNGLLSENYHEYGVDYRPTDKTIEYYRYN